MYSKSEQIEIMKSAGYSESAAKGSLNIGVWFFDSLEELQEFGMENFGIEFTSSQYDKGILNDKEVYFVDTLVYNV